MPLISYLFILILNSKVNYLLGCRFHAGVLSNVKLNSLYRLDGPLQSALVHRYLQDLLQSRSLLHCNSCGKLADVETHAISRDAILFIDCGLGDSPYDELTKVAS